MDAASVLGAFHAANSTQTATYSALATNGFFCKGGLLTHWGLSAVGENFLVTWLVFTALALVTVFATSGPLFYYYYWPTQVTYEKWQWKTNPQFPSPEKVRDEIVQMCKSVLCTTTFPAASVWCVYRGYGEGFCGSPDGIDWGYHALTFLGVLMASDFFEFFYHYCGHCSKVLWNQHKYHHLFFNPSPFAVIADEMADQLVRSSPLFLFPYFVPINIDLMFAMFFFMFYGYGSYLHWGYELDYPDAHHPILNSAFQHYCHHAKAIIGKPYHCGFFFKCWDQLFGSVYDKECFCVKCERAKGKRSLAAFKQIKVPDYNKLLDYSFWMDKGSFSGVSAQDKNE